MGTCWIVTLRKSGPIKERTIKTIALLKFCLNVPCLCGSGFSWISKSIMWVHKTQTQELKEIIKIYKIKTSVYYDRGLCRLIGKVVAKKKSFQKHRPQVGVSWIFLVKLGKVIGGCCEWTKELGLNMDGHFRFIDLNKFTCVEHGWWINEYRLLQTIKRD